MSLLRPEFLDRDLPITGKERRSIFREAWKRWLRNPVNFALHFGWFFLFIIPTQIPWGDWLPLIARRMGGLAAAVHRPVRGRRADVDASSAPAHGPAREAGRPGAGIRHLHPLRLLAPRPGG